MAGLAGRGRGAPIVGIGRAVPSTLNSIRLSGAEAAHAGLYAVLLFVALGTITALWPNPFFVRMTPVTAWDFALLTAEALLLGLYLALRAPGCAACRASVGGVLGFLGFGCTLCNKLLLVVLGAPLILQYVEPWRHGLGALGIAMLTLALWHKARRRGGLLPD